jgi:hypothetical protein
LRRVRFSRPEPDPSKDPSYQEIREDQFAEVPVVVPTSSEVVSGLLLPPDLARVVAAWNVLPEVIKAGVLAMINASQRQR